MMKSIYPFNYNSFYFRLNIKYVYLPKFYELGVYYLLSTSI